ncbi:hypothetical protein Fot_42448 [Forsythia ovata]|uniref:Uncharacterized protein n=1 Tax=Forsythia ovata TaxID=205694 RepID=A0ABD1RL63_9LAMI
MDENCQDGPMMPISSNVEDVDLVDIHVPLINSTKENMAASDSDFINCCDSNLIVASCSGNAENVAKNQEQVTQNLELENACQNSNSLSTTTHTTFSQIEISNLHEN